MTTVAFENDGVRVLVDERGGDALLITFNEVEAEHSGTSYWGRGVAERLGVSCVGVVDKARRWFPAGCMAGALAAIAGRRRAYGSCTAYGFSQGAYGVLKYSRALGADQALAFSPQITIDPGLLSGRDKRFLAYFRPDVHRGMTIAAGDLGPRSYVFHDPFRADDSWHGAEIGLLPGVFLVPVPFIGHETVRAVASSARMREILSLARGNASRAAMQGFMRSAKRQADSYYRHLGERLERAHKPRAARAVFRRGLAVNPAHSRINERLSRHRSAAAMLATAGKKFQDIRDHATAIVIFRTGLDQGLEFEDEFRQPAFLKEAYRSYLACGLFGDAEQLLREAAPAGVDPVWPATLRARAYAAHGAPERSSAEWRRVLAADPRNREARRALGLD